IESKPSSSARRAHETASPTWISPDGSEKPYWGIASPNRTGGAYGARRRARSGRGRRRSDRAGQDAPSLRVPHDDAVVARNLTTDEPRDHRAAVLVELVDPRDLERVPVAVGEEHEIGSHLPRETVDEHDDLIVLPRRRQGERGAAGVAPADRRQLADPR